jgi:hypothetical protein
MFVVETAKAADRSPFELHTLSPEFCPAAKLITRIFSMHFLNASSTGTAAATDRTDQPIAP